MIKNPFDLIIYEELIWQVRPTVVIEIGNASGGFSLWLSDRMKMVDTNGRVITIDIDSKGDTNLYKYKSDKLISIIGDCNDIKTIGKVRDNIGGNDKVLIIEDSSHTAENTLSVLQNYKDIISVGSYFIIEDGICDILDLGVRPGPMSAVLEWIKSNSNFQIDRECERYILTYNPNGYLKRIR